MQFYNKIGMKIIIADSVMVTITVCHPSHSPLKVANFELSRLIDNVFWHIRET